MQIITSASELGAKAEAIFYQKIKPAIAPLNRAKLVLIDVNSGAYEIGNDDILMEERLLANHPDAEMVLLSTDGGPTGQFGWPLTASE